MDETLPNVRRQKRKEPPKKVVRWVERYVRRETELSIVGAILLFLVGLVALVVTYGVWLFVVNIFTKGLFPLALTTRLTIAAAIVALLFVADRMADHEELHRVDVETDGGTRIAVHVSRVTGLGYFSPASRARSAGAFVKVLSILFLIAPQALRNSVRLAKRAARVRKLDVDGCARVLTELVTADGKVTFDDLAKRIRGVDWNTLLPLMRDVLGVVFLFTPPEGMTIADHLKEEIVDFK